MFTFCLLILVSALAKLEELLVPGALERQRKWLRNYRFRKENGWFARLCRSIPTQCPAQKLGLPPICKLNPLFEEMLYMQLKASDVAHQQTWIDMANAC